MPFDWNVIIGTGQSLSVGQFGLPAIHTADIFQNLMLANPSFPLQFDGDPEQRATRAAARSPLTDVVDSPSLPAGTIVVSRPDAATSLGLSHPWEGRTGQAELSLHHEMRDDSVAFVLPVNYTLSSDTSVHVPVDG